VMKVTQGVAPPAENFPGLSRLPANVV